MKTFILLLATSISLNASAEAIMLSPYLTLVMPSNITSGNPNHKELKHTLDDVQDFIQTGDLSIHLNKKVNDLMKQDETLSFSDALEIIAENASAELSKTE